jgi:hypothetical protein
VTNIAGRSAIANIILQNSQNNRGEYTSGVAALLSEHWAAFNKKQFARGPQELMNHLRFRGKQKSDE